MLIVLLIEQNYICIGSRNLPKEVGFIQRNFLGVKSNLGTNI